MLMPPWSDPGLGAKLSVQAGDKLPARQMQLHSNPLHDPPASSLQFVRGRAAADLERALSIREPKVAVGLGWVSGFTRSTQESIRVGG